MSVSEYILKLSQHHHLYHDYAHMFTSQCNYNQGYQSQKDVCMSSGGKGIIIPCFGGMPFGGAAGSGDGVLKQGTSRGDCWLTRSLSSEYR
ncbi:unnamed protein product [Fusarium graminearum]|uniref:Chromosome 4, complete genome n=1 Tax=Gibberella zeae (strain ATCC MYA-4620 / CBS 123657 / FGSC 9075 / NRRL 31084 / PH-1) TaxID=229533 RepID=A0A098DQP2_GIBZE|nr:unnamed protein product [Fusarium graminearum]CZS72284.1 unnamed protein product [Fusarium graminearum]